MHIPLAGRIGISSQNATALNFEEMSAEEAHLVHGSLSMSLWMIEKSCSESEGGYYALDLQLDSLETISNS
jgi:hypothetical protein